MKMSAMSSKILRRLPLGGFTVEGSRVAFMVSVSVKRL
jgi:hypothetical protein